MVLSLLKEGSIIQLGMSMLVKLSPSSDLDLVLKYSGSVRGRTASD